MKRIVIVTTSFLDYNTGKLSIGGVQTYMYNLSLACMEEGYEVIVRQFGNVEERREFVFKGIKCEFVPTKSNQASFDSIFSKLNGPSTIFIIGTDQMDIKSKAKNVIAIQHGIAFDIPGYMIQGFWGRTRLLQSLSKMLRCIKNVLRMNYVKNTVCVDYNYYNWFKTLGTVRGGKNIFVIPNYSGACIDARTMSEKTGREAGIRKVVFARRFEEHRGPLMFARVVRRLIEDGEKIDVTFAGNGPCLEQVTKIIEGLGNIHFTSYQASESVNFHAQFDIAVVPTIFSEGTSLSICEAMSAGCFPVCTYVGGLSNIILDHYNGLLCSPTEDELYSSMKEVLAMSPDVFNEIRERAYQTATTAFSLDLWKKKWMGVLRRIC